MIFVHFAVTSEQSSMKQRRHSQRGEGKLKAVLFAAIGLFAVYLAFKFVPPYVSEYQLQDKMQEQARFGIVNRYSEEQIRDNVFKVAQDLDLAMIKREDIKVSVSLATVKISLEYTVPVEMFFYSTELHFSPSSENKSLMQ
jgi:hypothetical protein